MKYKEFYERYGDAMFTFCSYYKKEMMYKAVYDTTLTFYIYEQIDNAYNMEISRDDFTKVINLPETLKGFLAWFGDDASIKIYTKGECEDVDVEEEE